MYQPQDGYSGYGNFRTARPAEYYDTDQGIKKSLAHNVADSANKYSILTSKVERFTDRAPQAPFVDYNIDTAFKKSVSRAVADSPVKYAATFSKTSRFAPDPKPQAPDVVYDTDTLAFKTVAREVDEHPVKYANVHSNAPRFGLKPKSYAPDIVYDTNQHTKTSLTKSVDDSKLKYSIMRSKQDRLKALPTGATSELLGPGTYECPCPLDLKKDYSQRSFSSFASTVPRFNHKRDPTKYLGSTYTPEHDRKAWGQKHFRISPTKIQRPAYLPSVYGKS
mmetsp:Transcript_9398/g.10868  ORF Transcript_9398/g.10868 Transcript_9398/m.10868 type:complete len:278 (-) Transcript_9398:682-1515(-)|eukprot:CAMPEP_0197852868 /NCGR_PEP_ID=MMETSP1438-20131217/21588_1 /TAXON_ID=1461541 /ORGANISM="Pterosperma sp., Strain CCMP1384" /LENGTH=277 /DNA_ID=CAMNT_0043467075 /DNA_START=181 /DNA_END=1014 /DNA_ORIENTATION=-